MTELFERIRAIIPTIGGWTSVEKANTFAALILGIRPEVTCEVGVWCGRGSLSMGMAHKEIGRGVVWSIDAWSATASAEGQQHEADKNHWLAANHEAAYQQFIYNVQALNLQHCVKVIRERSANATPPEKISLLILDGNHGPEAVKDVQRYAPKVRMGGFVYMDDLNWTGGNVLKAANTLKTMGFTELYPLETGMMYQRV